jgi:2-dehydropantoate 2-reductase
LEQADFTVATVADLEALVWGKLAINAAINPLTALLRMPNGELLSSPTTRDLMGRAAREVAAVAAARGITLPYPDPAAAAEDVATRTATNSSSMLQDVRRGALTEIDAICGAVVAAGAEVGVRTPINQILWQLVKSLHQLENSGITGIPFPVPSPIEAERS